MAWAGLPLVGCPDLALQAGHWGLTRLMYGHGMHVQDLEKQRRDEEKAAEEAAARRAEQAARAEERRRVQVSCSFVLDVHCNTAKHMTAVCHRADDEVIHPAQSVYP